MTVRNAKVDALAATLALFVCGCLGGRFHAQDPKAQVLDEQTRIVVDVVAAERKAANLQPPSLVAELGPPAVRAAISVARGEKSLKTAAYAAAQDAVTEVGRHVWTYATECTDLQRFRGPPMVLQQKTLLLGASAVAAGGGRTIVLLVVAEPGPSALRADQMGGGPGGTNPNVASYAHPTVATGACGESWPSPPRGTF